MQTGSQTLTVSKSAHQSGSFPSSSICRLIDPMVEEAKDQLFEDLSLNSSFQESETHEMRTVSVNITPETVFVTVECIWYGSSN